MPRPSNPKIIQFKERVAWITENLDTDPRFIKFISPDNTDDNFTALEYALQNGTYIFEDTLEGTRPIRRSFDRKGWTNALTSDRPSPVITDWLCVLYPDLTREQLFAPTFEEFVAFGGEIENARLRWLPAVRYFSDHRAELNQLMKNWYGARNFVSLAGNKIPLITKTGWIRKNPKRLTIESETEFISVPRHAIESKAPILEGLLGDYSTYRGKEGYPARRTVYAEPQHNGEIFCAESVVLDSKKQFCGFTYRLGRYFDYLNSCEILGAELSDWVLRNPNTPLPKRFSIRGSPEDIFDLTNRAAYPGINCLTIVKNYAHGPLKRGHYYLVHKRDDTQLQAQWSLHVAPAGGHQGFSKAATVDDTRIIRTIIREFAEELFNKEGLVKQFEQWQDFETHYDIKELAEAFFWGRNPAATVNLLGFGLDPVTTKPEVLCVMVIDWDIAKQNLSNPKFEFNWEFKTAGDSKSRIAWLPLNRESLILDALGPRHLLKDRYLEPLPAGAACMLLVANHWEKLNLD